MCISVINPEPKGVSRCPKVFPANGKPLDRSEKMREDLYLMVSSEKKNYSHVICFSPEERDSSSSWI